MYPELEGIFVLPLKPSASWWHLVKDMKQVRYVSAGTQLFTKPDGQGGRKRLHECPFDVVVIMMQELREMPMWQVGAVQRRPTL